MLERAWRRGRNGPVLSVVVPVYDVEEHIDACLGSIRTQRYRSIEIVVVDDGSTDGSIAIARRHAERDRRIRIVGRPNGGLSAARNTGVEAATGEFLTFVDADDIVTADGFTSAMTALTTSGSQIAVLRYGRLRDGAPAKAAAWIRELHDRPGSGVTLEHRPDVMVNATAWAKVFRRDFYDRAGLRFVEGVIYEDQAFTAEAYAKADAIDILPTTAYLWRVNAVSMSQGQVTTENLRGRLAAAEASLDVLASHPAARAERALQQLRYNLPNSLLKLERADDDYLGELVARVGAIVAAAPPDRYTAEVPAQFRVLYALLQTGDHDRVWRFVNAEGMQSQMHPTGIEPAGFTAYLPGWGDDPVPPEAYVLTDDQTALKVRVRRAVKERGDLMIDVAAWFPHVDLEAFAPYLSVKTDGDHVDVTHHGEPVVVASRQGAERRYPGSGWTVTIRGVGRRLPRDLEVDLVAGPFRGTATAPIRL